MRVRSLHELVRKNDESSAERKSQVRRSEEEDKQAAQSDLITQSADPTASLIAPPPQGERVPRPADQGNNDTPADTTVSTNAAETEREGGAVRDVQRTTDNSDEKNGEAVQSDITSGGPPGMHIAPSQQSENAPKIHDRGNSLKALKAITASDSSLTELEETDLPRRLIKQFKKEQVTQTNSTDQNGRANNSPRAPSNGVTSTPRNPPAPDKGSSGLRNRPSARRDTPAPEDRHLDRRSSSSNLFPIQFELPCDAISARPGNNLGARV
ncbi:hypothetical protein K470DRAFT_296787 [Piedraia hortae CBS 480.64]|uniref:Uncharacterized protein n=1 Tax=Piedraia hortae CBS 480.64 TaxID=1314780 RepID=A0A6A7BT28_9PEZI|nr:hypothetical protein K470DRAFT_296787 [Piedraia hortae CBS 480.64]